MMASIRFFKLFDMLARMGYKKTDLKTEIGLSSTTIAKLSKGGVRHHGHHPSHLRAIRRAAGRHHGVRPRRGSILEVRYPPSMLSL